MLEETDTALSIEEAEEPGPNALSEEAELELSEDSREAIEDALPTEEEERPGPDALELLEQESSADGLKATDPALPGKEETESGLSVSLEDKNGLEELELLKDTEEVPSDA